MKRLFAWSIAIVITLSAVIYQRISGPTNPLKNSVEIDGESYSFKLYRSMERSLPYNFELGESDPFIESFEIKMKPSNEKIRVLLMWKRYKSDHPLTIVEGVEKGGLYSFELPAQPPAGKISYLVTFIKDDRSFRPNNNHPVLLRFKDRVSPLLLIVHILLMFSAMLLSTYTAAAALFKLNSAKRAAIFTVLTLFVGGLVLGPFVQKAAFGEWWSGWPLGGDLTDTKTLIALLVWVVAIVFNRKRERGYLWVVAAVVLLLIYTIPHSAAGSEFDWDKGVVSTSTRIE
ncbi:MAG: hypothetical protein WC960_07525 [Bacteroidales bacterium]